MAFLAVILVLGEALRGFDPQAMWVNLHYAAFILLQFAVMDVVMVKTLTFPPGV